MSSQLAPQMGDVETFRCRFPDELNMSGAVASAGGWHLNDRSETGPHHEEHGWAGLGSSTEGRSSRRR